ncbi:hypothetical protein P2G88_16745 [Aliiglaciecola sp. CAU 1673]|uniref:hypothetical protein n=1 Tax=Aliiglaciecola sp. CAU 1673 TaxID=3032595 RepID=UPI0023DADB82|nr:hypothetical protein [Aliiglaciecola sp. CAU 1673]MDF2179903.1 hypothetical protein [Aliiglaciecola sp. CAU 1673]
MTTLRDLEKYAKEDFIPFLKNHGFKLFGTFKFYREIEQGLYHVIDPEIHYGENLIVYIRCHVDEISSDMGFESGIVGGELDPTREIKINNSYLWKIPDEMASRKALEEIKKSLSDYALPFFDKVKNRKELLKAVHPINVEEFQEDIDRILEVIQQQEVEQKQNG